MTIQSFKSFLILLLFSFSASLMAQNGDVSMSILNQNPNGLTLNKGNKWEIDKSMMSYLDKMENDINNNIIPKMTNYSVLAQDLVTNVNTLVTTCTMDGPAHDELHKWLVPYIDLVNKLNEAEKLEEAQMTHANLKKEFVTFGKYFE